MIDDDPELANPYVEPEHKQAEPAKSREWTVVVDQPPVMVGESLIGRRDYGCLSICCTFVCSMMLCAAILWSGARDSHVNPDVIDEDRQEQQDNSPEPQPAVDIQGAKLIYVYERTSPTVEQVEALRQYSQELLVSMGMTGFAAIDDNDTGPAKPFIDWANGRGVPIPAAFLLKDRTILRGVKFESAQDIKGLLGG